METIQNTYCFIITYIINVLLNKGRIGNSPGLTGKIPVLREAEKFFMRIFNLDFKVDLNQISERDIILAKNSFKQALISLVKYLPVNDEIIRAFQLIDPRKRIVHRNIWLFRVSSENIYFML